MFCWGHTRRFWAIDWKEKSWANAPWPKGRPPAQHEHLQLIIGSQNALHTLPLAFLLHCEYWKYSHLVKQVLFLETQWWRTRCASPSNGPAPRGFCTGSLRWLQLYPHVFSDLEKSALGSSWQVWWAPVLTENAYCQLKTKEESKLQMIFWELSFITGISCRKKNNSLKKSKNYF